MGSFIMILVLWAIIKIIKGAAAKYSFADLVKSPEEYEGFTREEAEFGTRQNGIR